MDPAGAPKGINLNGQVVVKHDGIPSVITIKIEGPGGGAPVLPTPAPNLGLIVGLIVAAVIGWLLIRKE